jgi:hypothetical protein
VPHYVTTASEFFECYAYFVRANPSRATLEVILFTLAFILNWSTVALIYHNSISWSVFDTILISHCIVQGVTAGIDIPFYHMQDMFGYWPLPKIMSYFWASYDNNINTTTNLNMLYMCWARLRSIQAPTRFKDEFLLKHPKMVLSSFWVIGLTIWTPVAVVFNTQSFSASLNYRPLYLQLIINVIFWFTLMIGIIYYSSK